MCSSFNYHRCSCDKEREKTNSQSKQTQKHTRKRKEIIDQNENSVKRRKPEDIFGYFLYNFVDFSDECQLPTKLSKKPSSCHQ
jgi:hypothetical protein